MKTVRLFLASSITDLHSERVEIGNFIRVLNDCMMEDGRNIYFQLSMCEYISDSVANGRKQDVYNSGIRESDLCVFLFWHWAREYTLEELDVAWNSHNETGKPRIMVFLKDVRDEHPFEPSIERLILELKKKKQHITRFNSVDTVLLHILNSLANSNEDEMTVDCIENSIYLNGIKLSEINLSKVDEEE